MVVARRSDGRLVIHDALALDEEGMSELESLGKPAYIIVANASRRLDAPDLKRRFPKAQVFAPRGTLQAVEKVVKVDGLYEDVPPDDDVRFELLHGIADAGAMIVRSTDGVTVILDDAIVDTDRKRQPLDVFSSSRVSRLFSKGVSLLDQFVKSFVVKDKRALREDLERYAEDPDLVRLVVVAPHAQVARGAAAAQALREAASFL
jgi:hypothetical protein